MAKTAFIISGAAAFIAQELALVSTLFNGDSPSGIKVKPDLLAGASSGSLSSVVINGIIANMENPQKGISWDEIKKILFGLKNRDVYRGTFILSIIYHALFKGYIYNTNPLKKTLKEIVNKKIGFNEIKDLPVQTYISTVNRNSGETFRFTNQDKEHHHVNLVDLLMASTAIPVAFPARDIKSFGTFVDGGTGTDNVPIEVLTNFPKGEFEEVYVITFEHSLLGISGKFQWKDHSKFPKIVSDLSFAYAVQSNALFLYQLERALDLVTDPNKAFIYMPKLPEHYSLLDFSVMEKQFNQTLAWAKQNDPMLIKDFLKDTNLFGGTP